jgi:hypothetical protein
MSLDGGCVDLGDPPTDRGVEIGDGFGRLHLTARLADRDGGADLGQVDEHQLAQ